MLCIYILISLSRILSILINYRSHVLIYDFKNTNIAANNLNGTYLNTYIISYNLNMSINIF